MPGNTNLDTKAYILDLVKSLKSREGNIEGLISYLETSDFFTAPATTQYFYFYRGGLVDYIINVYTNLVRLVKAYPDTYSEDTLKIVSLFHALYKVDYYESYLRNVKDEYGNWVQEENFRVKENRYTLNSYGVNSFMILSQFIPLTEEEIAAIMNHKGFEEENIVKYEMYKIMGKFPLVVLLNSAINLTIYCKDLIKYE